MAMNELQKKEYNLNYRTKRIKQTFKPGDKAIVNWERSSINNKEVIITRKGFGSLFWVKHDNKEVVLRSSQLRGIV